MLRDLHALDHKQKNQYRHYYHLFTKLHAAQNDKKNHFVYLKHGK